MRILRKHEMIPSMSRPANPYDNASCESFMKTLKREEIYANEYRDLDRPAHQHRGVHRAATTIASGSTQRWATGRRKSSSRPLNQAATSAGATMSFFRHKEIFRSDVDSFDSGETAETASPAHRLDESPAGYSLAGWSPPEPASASPTEDHSGRRRGCLSRKIQQTASVPIAVCLNRGVHPTRLCPKCAQPPLTPKNLVNQLNLVKSLSVRAKCGGTPLESEEFRGINGY